MPIEEFAETLLRFFCAVVPASGILQKYREPGIYMLRN
jgi:hypothetical protein